MNVVKKAKFVLFFDTFIKDLENQAKDLVSRLKCIIIYLSYITSCKSTWDSTLFWLHMAMAWSGACEPPSTPYQLARPSSKLKGTTLNGEKEVVEYFLLQKCDCGSDLQ